MHFNIAMSVKAECCMYLILLKMENSKNRYYKRTPCRLKLDHSVRIIQSVTYVRIIRYRREVFVCHSSCLRYILY